MRCEAHPEDEAVGTCKSCGRGVCTICKVLFNGIIHCKGCVEAGRISGGGSVTASAPAPVGPGAAAPASPYAVQYAYPSYPYAYAYPYLQAPAHVPATPKPTGPPSRSYFLTGAAGGVAGGIMMLVAGAAMFWGLLIGAGYPSDLWLAIAAVVVLGATQVLSAVGMFGLFRNYGVRMGLVSAGTLIVCAVLFPLALAFAIPDAYQYGGYPGYPVSNYGNRFDFPVTYLGAIPFATAMIVEGSTLLVARRYFRDPRNANTVGIVAIIGGGLIAGFFGLFVIGWLLLAVSRFISTPLYLQAPVPEKGPQKVESPKPMTERVAAAVKTK